MTVLHEPIRSHVPFGTSEPSGMRLQVTSEVRTLSVPTAGQFREAGAGDVSSLGAPMSVRAARRESPEATSEPRWRSGQRGRRPPSPAASSSHQGGGELIRSSSWARISRLFSCATLAAARVVGGTIGGTSTEQEQMRPRIPTLRPCIFAGPVHRSGLSRLRIALANAPSASRAARITASPGAAHRAGSGRARARR